jgi:hypothetical protein
MAWTNDGVDGDRCEDCGMPGDRHCSGCGACEDTENCCEGED